MPMPPTRPARCPRCGYDLVGEVASWHRQCPLEGRCPECGLAFRWPRVLALSVHPWLFEYHWRRKPVRRLLRTWRQAHHPIRFWRDVRLTDPVHLRPLAVVCLCAALLVFGGLISVTVMSSVRSPWVVWPGGTAVRSDLLELFGLAAWDLCAAVATLLPGLVVALAAMPAAFALLPQTLRRARVRRAHVARIWLYSLFCPLTVAAFWTLVLLVGANLGLDALVEAMNPWEWARGLGPMGLRSVRFFAAPLPGIVASALVLAWLTVWWWSACRSYLRLPRSGLIVLALSLTVGLAALAAQLWVWLLT